MKTLALTLASAFAAIFAFGTIASAEPPADAPATESKAETALLEGLKLIRDNNFDGWASQYCSTEKLCFNANSKKSLKRYNFPAKQRRAQHCIKDGAIKVTRTDKVSDTEVKLFIACEETAMPVPFRLGLEKGKWKFYSL